MTQPEAHEDSRDSGSLSSRLRHVYWIGGASGSGKSTIARRLAALHGSRPLRMTGSLGLRKSGLE
jgi:adenylylsulfate kinase-like enzyme